jgi:hypothetical protein
MTDSPLFDMAQEKVIERGQLDELIDRRTAVYGEPVECFTRIALVWSGITGLNIQAYDVPLMMAGMKAVRAQITPDYSDNSDDIEGYLDIFRQVVGEDMIHARSVTEYIELKDARP